MSRSPDAPKTSRERVVPKPLSFEDEFLSLLPQLRRYARSLTRSAPESEDLLQDCVEKALVNRAAWQGTNLKAWACRIMTNLHLNTRRFARRRPTVAIEEAEAATMATTDDPLARGRLLQAVESLAPEARTVLMLVVVEGYSYREVADILSIPEGTVMSRLSRARQSLRDKMRAENIIPLRRLR